MSTMLPKATDVVIVGAGNAALCAALAEAGGNSRFTAGAFRCVYDGVEDLKALMPDLTAEEIANTDFGTYTEAQFFDDMGRVTEYRTDPELCEILVTRSKSTMRWMRDKGIRFAPIYGRQAFKVDGKFKFWGGLTVEAYGGGPGMIESHRRAAVKHGIPVIYETRALSLLHDDEGVQGLTVRH